MRQYFQAMLATIGVSMRYGMWRAVGEELGCNKVSWFTWLGLGALFSSTFLRVFRYHDVLVRQSGVMWPVACQVSGREEQHRWRKLDTHSSGKAAKAVCCGIAGTTELPWRFDKTYGIRVLFCVCDIMFTRSIGLSVALCAFLLPAPSIESPSSEVMFTPRD